MGSNARLVGTWVMLIERLICSAGRTTVWGSGATNGNTIGAAPSKAARTVDVYGRVAAGQDVSAASYTDTVVATINF